MQLQDFSASYLSLAPAAIALLLSIITRKVLLSLGIGIVLGGLLLNNWHIADSATYIYKQFAMNVYYENVNYEKIDIAIFLIFLGMITALLTLSGGTQAFAQWAEKRIKTKRGAGLLAAILGVVIFVDDYFNSLAVGSISRPVTERYHISSSKLAYILDSTAAPVCVIMPASSWGAYIMTIISGILVTHGITEYTPFQAFIQIVPMNFYAVFALIMVFAVVIFNLNIGPMRRKEREVAHKQGTEDDSEHQAERLDPEIKISGRKDGSIADLIAPIALLVFATVAAMLITGGQALGEDAPFSVLGAFENTNVGASLVWGSAITLGYSLLTVLWKRIAIGQVAKTLIVGAYSMFAAIIILLFAWAIGNVIGDIETGKYLSSLAQSWQVNAHWIPVLLFLLSGVMAFATGTSWSTFGIMLPIAGNLAADLDISLMFPMLSAVLAGSVFGDHCSPISDTTILSSTGAACNHIDHVVTQLPYALMIAVISCLSFAVLAYTESLLIAYLVGIIAIVLAIAMIKRAKQQA